MSRVEKAAARAIGVGVLLGAVLAAAAHAAPVTWTLTGVTFDDGSTVSGSFVYDAATNQYSNVAITTTATPNPVVPPNVTPTPPLPGDSYANIFTCTGCTFAPSATSLRLLTQPQTNDQTGLNALRLKFPALTDAGGTVTLPLTDPAIPTFPASFEGACMGVTPPPVPASQCPTNDFGRRLAAGSLVGVPVAGPVAVPTLGEWGLLALGALVAGLAWRSRRSARTAA